MKDDTRFTVTQDMIDDLARTGIRLVASTPLPRALPDESTILKELAAFLVDVRPYIDTRFGHEVTDTRHVKELRLRAFALQMRIKEVQENERRLFPFGEDSDGLS